MAIDIGVEIKGKLSGIGGTKAYDWMCENAPNYGFYLQGTPTRADGSSNPEYEAWHWQYCIGDATAPALLIQGQVQENSSDQNVDPMAVTPIGRKAKKKNKKTPN